MSDAFGTTPTPAQPFGLAEPRALEGVRSRRSVAFLLDYALILILSIPAAIVVGLLGILTLGLGWLLYGVLLPVVALVYVGFTLGGSAQATPGMRLAGIRFVRLDRQVIDPIYAVLHSVLFWASCTILTPLVLAFALFTDRKQTLHDYLLGTVAVRTR